MRTHDAKELRNMARQFTERLQPDAEKATLVTLSGELGAGKTTFAQGVARALGVAETVSSPTFVIEKVYELTGQKFERLVHIDAYRLKDSKELRMLGWLELSANPKNLIVIEWPERVAELIPEHAIRIRLDIDGDGRIITINGAENGIDKSSG